MSTYYELNKEKCQAKVKEWQLKNRERMLAKKKEYRKKHKAEIAEKNKIYQQENRDIVNASSRRYKARHPERVKVSRKKYNEDQRDFRIAMKDDLNKLKEKHKRKMRRKILEEAQKQQPTAQGVSFKEQNDSR